MRVHNVPFGQGQNWAKKVDQCAPVLDAQAISQCFVTPEGRND